MAAPRGNQFWKARTTHGRDKLFDSQGVLWAACAEYFEWVEENPLITIELVKYQGEAKQVEIPKMRAMTISGLCIFLDIHKSTWYDYCSKDDFSDTTSRVEEIIRTQKFEGASAELFNPNIIARDLGLVDKKDHTGKVKVGVMSRSIDDDMTDTDAAEVFADFLKEDE